MGGFCLKKISLNRYKTLLKLYKKSQEVKNMTLIVPTFKNLKNLSFKNCLLNEKITRVNVS